MPRKMKEAACPPECGFTMRWNEDDFTDEEMKQLFELMMKHMVRSHNYPDTPEVREKLKKENHYHREIRQKVKEEIRKCQLT